MLKRISNLPVMAYLFLSDFINNFRKDERGLSGVVVAILLILVAVLAVVLIWGFLSGWLRTVWDNIVREAGTIS
jgi:flagellin-like protein